MTLGTEYVLLVVIFLVWLDIFIVLRTLLNKSQLALSDERRSRELAELAHLFDIHSGWDKKKVRRLFNNYLHLKQSIDLPEEERQRILKLARVDIIGPRLIQKVRSRSRYSRMEAALGLALVADDNAREALENALRSEKDYPVKLFIANALADIKDPRSLGVLTESLLGAHRWYRDKVNMLIASFGLESSDYLRGYFWRSESEIIEMLVDIAGQCICEALRDYLLSILELGQKMTERLAESVQGCPEKCCAYCRHGQMITEGMKRECRYEGTVAPDFKCRRFSFLITSLNPAGNYHRLVVKAAENVSKYYSPSLNKATFLDNADNDVRNIAIQSLGTGDGEEHVKLLIGYLNDDRTSLSARQGLSRILSMHPRLIPIVVTIFEQTVDKRMKHNIAEALAGRIEYFIGKLMGRDGESSVRLIHELLEMGKVSEIIEFLKLNKDIELEDIVIGILREVAGYTEKLRTECGIYLPDRILEKCGIARIVPPVKKREEKRDWKMIRILYVILAFALFFFPFLYLVRYGDHLRVIPIVEQLKTFIIDFNYDFAWYSFAVNAGYIVLLLLSTMKVRTSTKLWNLKTMSLLFKPRMLPSVSIIAPAYNEEKTIIESANSLLNLKYPEYELVVVNDGSQDGTLNTLITYYDLKRSEYHFLERLKTAPVRAIYLNPLYPRLVVIDKDNGGKADSLNAGINIASKEYYCGIDADSLLEPDSLLKLAALTLDYGVETPGLGGNVFPINGCDIDRGKLTRIALPQNNLARLQTIEYLRAFMCGRLGWAQINSLLIISGAFGLFRKERVLAIGGYLTSNERYGRDTVGEDMELVVRIARFLREKKQKFRISYAYNANCWTEVPEDIKTLKRQRDRWHRGLIDIMFFHRKLVFNPAFGRMGLVGMPYFLIFEMIGPLFEIQGYIMVGLAALFGLMSVKLALLLFLSTILMGIMISMASVLIAERQIFYFNYRDTLRMFVMAFLENFGPRQIFSMWRVFGFFSAMRTPKGWGKMDRKGFAPPGTRTTEQAATPLVKEGTR